MEIKPSKAKNKKFTAVFSHDKDGKRVKIKTSQFGDSRFEDYTQHLDKVRRKKYRARHSKDLKKGTYMSPGFLSYYLLWGNSGSLDINIKKYKKMFKLK
jgi:hypothetical protein|tara:strand:+ start:1510 stop:1806 length:297 start_codon:yes stop_codon:yes gene_type:complete